MGALANLGYQVSDQTVGNILRRHGIAPVPERSQTTTWRDFISPAHGRSRRHGLLYGRGADLARPGDVLCPIFHFMHLDSRRVSLAGITDHPEACWMRQVACNATLEGIGQRNGCRYVLHDRDAKFCAEFGRPWQQGA